MAQLSKDSFAFGGGLMPVDAALELIKQLIKAVAETEQVSLLAADNRVLADALIAPINLPPFDNSAVDGYAVRHAELSTDATTILSVEGRVAAGDAWSGAQSRANVAVRVFTGAPMPPGLDTVFMQEDVSLVEGGAVSLPVGLKRGANSRPAGEDIAAGHVAINAGRRLTPRDIALAAALGVTSLTVRRKMRVAVFSTGNEVTEPGHVLGPAALYDANRFTLQTLITRLGAEVTDLGILPDRREAIVSALREAGAAHDLILTSGGVSTGEEDHVKGAVEDAGALTFWRIGIKPGRPVAMGVVGQAAFVGLPGNPVAVFVTFTHIVRPLLASLSGEVFSPTLPLPVVAGFSYRKKEGRREYVRVSLERSGDGRITAQKHPREGAGVITSLTETDGLVELAEETLSVEPGDQVGFIPYAGLM